MAGGDPGQRELAYRQYAFEANQANTNLGTLKALAAKYPEKDKARILTDLVEANPGSEGKWFAAAKTEPDEVEELDVEF